MGIETIRLSEKGKSQLVNVKRRTGIANWNILCRWAYCLSLAEPSPPPDEEIPSDSSVEMTWKVFSGNNSEIYIALLRERAKIDKYSLTEQKEPYYFRLHLHRGISYLNDAAKINSIEDLLALATNASS